MSLRTAIDELREAVATSSWEPLADKTAKVLTLALRGKAQVHVADEAGPQGEIDIWLEPVEDAAFTSTREVNRVLAAALGDKVRMHARVTREDDDGIVVTVGP
jgi:hypothetical protein